MPCAAGPDEIVVVVDDQGHSGEGGAKSATQTLAVLVTEGGG